MLTSIFSEICVVKKDKKNRLSFVIDGLTNSIQNTVSGDSFQTEVSAFTNNNVKESTKKNNWQFNWKQELANYNREAYKLTFK